MEINPSNSNETSGLNVPSGTNARQQEAPPTPGATATMSGSSLNDGFLQAMLKSALDTIPQLTEENYSIWKDKMSALLQLQGALTKLESTNLTVLDADTNAELILLIISKIDSVTHKNVVTADNWKSAKSLWEAIIYRFASSQAYNRAQIFNKFLYIKFKEDLVKSYVTDVKVSIKKLVDVVVSQP